MTLIGLVIFQPGKKENRLQASGMDLRAIRLEITAWFNGEHSRLVFPISSLTAYKRIQSKSVLLLPSFHFKYLPANWRDKVDALGVTCHQQHHVTISSLQTFIDENMRVVGLNSC